MLPYPWQKTQWHTLFLQWEAQVLPHAILFAGPECLGKLHFAKFFAQFLLCQKNHLGGAEGPCTSCRSCLYFQAGSHPDFFFLSPEKEVIKIDQIRILLEALQCTAQSSLKVVVISLAEAMNSASVNALLKTLEEPLGATYFILVSHQWSLLPLTLKSRCQKVTFAPPDVSMGLKWLNEHFLEKEGTSSIPMSLALADHIPLLALSYLEDNRVRDQDRLLDYFIQLYQGEGSVGEMGKLCIELDKHFVYRGLYLVYKDLIRLQSSENNPILYENRSDFLKKIAGQVSRYHVLGQVDRLIEIKKIWSQNVVLNMQLCWESFFSFVVAP